MRDDMILVGNDARNFRRRLVHPNRENIILRDAYFNSLNSIEIIQDSDGSFTANISDLDLSFLDDEYSEEVKSDQPVVNTIFSNRILLFKDKQDAGGSAAKICFRNKVSGNAYLKKESMSECFMNRNFVLTSLNRTNEESYAESYENQKNQKFEVSFGKEYFQENTSISWAS